MTLDCKALGRAAMPNSDLDPASQPLNVQQVLLTNAVGNCLMVWAGIERLLHAMFSAHVVRQSRNKNKFVIADSIWSAVISFEARLKMVDASINGDLWKEETSRFEKVKADWRLLYNYIVRMSSKRNEIAHGTMMNQDGKAMVIVPYATTIPFRDGISITEVVDRATKFVELERSLDWLILCFSALWKPKLKRAVLSHRPTPDLVLRLRMQAAQSRKGKNVSRRTSRRKSKVHP
jgi:hypothetical protein